jgi:hypothetical protein
MTGTVRVNRDELALPGQVTVRFMRTLRIPETGMHPLPAGLGLFPVRRVADYPDTIPAEWSARGGVMIPLYQRVALWLSFSAGQPAALSVGVGKGVRHLWRRVDRPAQPEPAELRGTARAAVARRDQRR